MIGRAFRGRVTARGCWIGSIGFALCGLVVVAAEVIGGESTGQVIFAAVLFEPALGHSGAPFDWLAAIGGFTYLGAYVYGTRR